MTAARLGFASVLALATLASGASAASAATFYVSQSSGNDANPCTALAAPCKTIGAAVEKSEAASGAATIEVTAGVYQEALSLSKPADDGIAIVGAGSGPGGTEIEGPVSAGGGTVYLGVMGNSASMSHLSVVNPAGDGHSAIEADEQLALSDVRVEMLAASGSMGIDVGEQGELTFDGGAVTMGSATTGTAIGNARRTLTLDGVAIMLESGAKGAGIQGQRAPMSLSNVTVAMGSSASSPAITAGGAGVSMSDVAVTMDSASAPAIALSFAEGATAHTVSVAMADAASEQPGVEQLYGSATLDGLDVSGAWKGVAFKDEGGEATLRDSTLISAPSGAAPALVYFGESENSGLLVQRSVVEAPAKAVEGAAEIIGGNATFDSSELLGGERGVYFFQPDSKTRTLTLASSTVDAGTLGVRDVGALGVEALAENTASVADVDIEGSIVLEPQRANTANKDTASVTCSYSDVPSQSQAAGAGNGSIACADGESANTETNALAALFSAPIADYQLSPSSGAVDSVPSGAISLPFGFTPSSTDLDGNPRVVNGNGGCVAVEDRGALELQNHEGICKGPPPYVNNPIGAPRPVAVLGAITALKLSPDAFFAALSGATLSSVKRHYGTLIGYRDSQPGITTFTVLRASAGRVHGHSCAKPSHANRKGKRCTLYVSLGGFSRVDMAGANSLRFSGRLKGKQLAKGSYRLLATPSYGPRRGLAIHTEFKIA
jgi:hypothetical protein